MAAFKDSTFVGPVPCVIAPRFRKFLIRNTNMSFTEVMGQMKLSVDKNWHACFVSMAYTDKVKELVKGLFPNELLWAIYVWEGEGGGMAFTFPFREVILYSP